MTDQLNVASNQRDVESFSKTSNKSEFESLFSSSHNKLINDPFRYKSYTHDEYDRLIKDVKVIGQDIILGLIQDGSLDIYTAPNGILPWAKSDTLYYKMNKTIFDPPIAGIVPYEGVVRLVSTKSTSTGGALERRGIGFYMEVEALSTEAGQRALMYNLIQLAQAVKETCCYDTIYALLNCLDYEKKQQMLFGQLLVSYRQILENEVRHFSVLAQSDGGLDLLVEVGKNVLQRNNQIADTLIISPTAAVYFNMLQEHKVDYYLAGPEGPQQYKRDPFLITSYRGLDIVKGKFFSTSKDKNKEDPLQRQTSIGEYYEMAFEKRDEKLTRYESKQRNIYIYDENADEFKKVNFKEALLNTNIWNEDGFYTKEVFDFFDKYNSSHSKLHPNEFLKKYQKYQSNNESMAFRQMKNDYPNKMLPLSIATIQEDNETGELNWVPATFFGQMLSEFLTYDDLVQVASSFLLKMQCYEKDCDIIKAFNDLTDVIKGIQNQPYVHYYWEKLIAANIKSQLNSAGKFVGELTPESKNVDDWGDHQIIREWKPDLFGALRLPQIDFKAHPEIVFPAGFANGYGLLSLESELQNPESCWRHLAKKIKPGLELVKAAVALLKTNFSESICFDVDSRSPWFHKEDAVAVFLNNCIPLNGDPIFLSSAKPYGTVGDNDNTDETMNDDSVMYFAPFDYNWGTDLTTIYESLPEFKTKESKSKMQRKELTELTDKDYVVYTNPITKKPIVIQKTLIRRRLLPKYISVFYYLNTETATKYEAMLEKFINETDATYTNDQRIELLNEFADMMINLLTVDKIAAQKIISFIVNPKNKLTFAAINENVIKLYKNLIKTKKTNKFEKIFNTFSGEGEDNTTPVAKDTNMESLFFKQNKSKDENNNANAPPNPNLSQNLYQKIEDFYESIFLIPGIILTKDVNPLIIDDNLNTLNGLYSSALNSKNSYDTEENFIEANKEAIPKLTTSWRSIRTEFDSLNVLDSSSTVKSKLKNIEVYNAEYFRAPLTMSLELLNSLQGVSLPLIKPSDPETGFTEAITTGATNYEIPERLWKRTHYLNIEQRANQKVFDVQSLPYIDKISIGKFINQQEKGFSTKRNNNNNNNMHTDNDFSDADLFKSRKRSNDGYGSDYERNSHGKRSKNNNSQFIGAFNEEESLPQDTTKSQMRKMKNTNAFSSRGNLPYNGIIYQNVVNSVMRFRFDQISKCENPLLRMILHCIVVLPIEFNVISNMIDNNIHVPFNVYLFRPSITHTYSSCIMLKRGLQTGANLYHEINFMMQADATIKTVNASLTFHHASVVYDDRSVFVLNEVKPEAYHGGCNCNFIRSREDLEENHIDKNSIIAILSPITECELPTYCSITGNLPIVEINAKYDDDSTKHYVNYAYYANLFGLENRTRLNLMKERFSEREDRINVVCIPGAKFTYNPMTQLYSSWRPSKGHRGPDGNGRGCARVWSGQLEKFTKFNPLMYSLN